MVYDNLHFLVDFNGKCIGIYTSPMDGMGLVNRDPYNGL